MASKICQQDYSQPTTWARWTSDNHCNGAANPSAQVSYDTSSLGLPSWVSQNLAADGTFDVNAALNCTFVIFALPFNFMLTYTVDDGVKCS